MESVHGVDISWMSKHGNQNNASKAENTSKPAASPTHHTILQPARLPNGSTPPQTPKENPTSTPQKSVPNRPNFSRTASTEKTATLNGNGQKTGTPPANSGRRGSWLSSISSKFSTGGGNHQQNVSTPPASPQVPTTPPADKTIPPQQQHTHHPPHMFGSQKVAILQPAAKAVGDEPYIPAPPKTTQPSFLQSALRRLSSSGGQLQQPGKGTQNGLCERRVLNIDKNRERCKITELDQAKLRRVAFCVDVEIASGPRYIEDAADAKKTPAKQETKKKMAEKGEGDALKNPETAKKEKEVDGVVKGATDAVSAGSVTDATAGDNKEDNQPGEKDTTKKKEKKKRSEEERKARKEKKRKLAEANGTVPVELVRNDSDDSSLAPTPGMETPKTQGSPTTDPVRIYRRCCQLRETPILKKITEQLSAPIPSNGQAGVVNKLDLTDYWLQLPDLVTLGDYLAVVPVKELIMENCGLGDEGVRVVLAGLLAAKSPDYQRRRFNKVKPTEHPQGGYIERLVLKNNSKIGRDGWRHISLFINMCRSIKYLDLSKVPFPQSPPTPATRNRAESVGPKDEPISQVSSHTSNSSDAPDLAGLLGKALAGRLAGKELELLNFAECGLSTEQIGSVIDGVIKSGCRRLGVAGNKISEEGLQHVARYLREGTCEGLDLGGNDLKSQLGVIAEALDDSNEIYALSLADCNLDPDALWTLFPALAKLKNFKFIDLSQNHALFETQPSALSLLRRYMPKLPNLKRIHLTDVSMTPEQAIALAEILPESPNLAHVSIMENPKLAALANAKDEANQEEACALYASLMAAVRVSQTIVCIDIEVPSNESSEVVKALAKQVVAYCLWNMERGPVAEIQQASVNIAEPQGTVKDVAVPDVLMHLVGHIEGSQVNHDDDEPAPDEDYVIGGTGVVKALGICLRNSGNDAERPPTDRTLSDVSDASGTATPNRAVSGGKAKDMSKNLLGSARKIRARLQPALVKESRSGDRNNYQRLQFLDQTLMGMIKRFEDEFPETRLSADVTSVPLPDPAHSSPSDSLDLDLAVESRASDNEQALNDPVLTDDEDASGLRPVLSRHNSDVSIASRALAQEEGRMHRFGQKVRRDILKPQGEDATKPDIAPEPRHLEMLRSFVESLEGEEIKKRIEEHGEDKVIQEMNNDASQFRQMLMDSDPEGFEKFRLSMEAAQRNSFTSSSPGTREPEKDSKAPVSSSPRSRDDEEESAIVD